MRPPSEILIEALAILDDGKAWYKGTLFNTGRASTADKFCAIGAIHKSMHKHGEIDSDVACCVSLEGQDLVRIVQQFNISAGTNDRAGSFEPVRKMFCRAIKKAVTAELESEEKNGTSQVGGHQVQEGL